MSNWLDIIGVTEAGLGALPEHLKSLVSKAKTVLGPARLVDQIPPRPDQTKQVWKSGYEAMTKQVIALRPKDSDEKSMAGTIGAEKSAKKLNNQRTVIFATGDPNWFGIGTTLARHLEPEEFALHPALSGFQLAAAKMHWPLQGVTTISLHGRAVENLHPHILPQNRILALTSNSKTLAEVAHLLVARGYGQSAVTVLENLGGSDERQLSFSPKEAERQNIGDFYTLAIDCVANPAAPLLPTIPGLPDDAFLNDGQLSKRQVRAATLAALAPFPGALLWDVGAGSGSIGIEWMRAARNASAICFERKEIRAKNIKQNAKNLGVPDLKVISGSAPASLDEKPTPDAIFIGGAVADDAVFEACWKALRPGGHLAANAVTLAGQAALLARYEELGGELCEIAISTLTTIGKHSLLKPRLPVTQWAIRKPTP